MKLGDFKFLKRENKGDREMAYLGFGNSALNNYVPIGGGFSNGPATGTLSFLENAILGPRQSGPMYGSWYDFGRKRAEGQAGILMGLQGIPSVQRQAGNDVINNLFSSNHSHHHNDSYYPSSGGGSSLNQFQNALISGINTINGQNSVSRGGVNFNANNHLNWISQAGNFSGNQNYFHPHSAFSPAPTINPSIMANLGFGGHNAFRW
ncbi:MAG: hypothetical protein MK033_04525 [Candidatus Caenarcaniphilales bacterium]|nr:hypothetical protein [Candidatus Caenarcaniphilales bacterium]